MPIPQILQQLGMRAVQQNPNAAQIQKLMNAAKNAPNGEALMQQMINSNPQYSQALKEMQAQGGTLKEVFMNRAKSMGLSDNEIINMLK